GFRTAAPATEPASRGPAARADRRADAARRAGRELLVPAPPRGLRVDRPAGARAAGRRPRLRGGLRLRGARPYGAQRGRRRRQSGGLRPRAPALPRAQPALRARPRRDLERRRRLRRLPPDHRARRRARGAARPPPRPRRTRRRGLRLDAQRPDPRAARRRALRQPVASARVPAGGVPRAISRRIRRRRPAGRPPCRQAAPAPGGRRAARLGCGPLAAQADAALLRRLRAGHLGARLRRPRRRPRRVPRPPRRAARL
ncbi:MAG: hypothetical protein AVDCRST_MAG65-508, partial [uncultured Solirubrobacteraceae bacterium]